MYVLKAKTGGFGTKFGFPRGDTSLPLHPGIGLSTAKIQLIFELRKEIIKKM